jgi:hypothetical protein
LINFSPLTGFLRLEKTGNGQMMKSIIPLVVRPEGPVGPLRLTGNELVCFLLLTSTHSTRTPYDLIATLAGAYHGGFRNALQYAGDPAVREAVGKAMEYWFARDFVNHPECLDKGGLDVCPCDNPENTLW